MYSVVLATVLTAGGATPDCWWSHSCWTSCHGCYSSCYGCSGSCTGWGCYGSCHGWGCYGSCNGCWSSCYGSCYGCSASCYGSCYGTSWTPSYASAVPTYSNWSPPGSAPQMQKVPEISTGMQAASVVIKASPDVKLKVNGQATPLDSVEQRFRTPLLQAGQVYSYEIVATGMRDGKEVSETRKVLVRAGQESRVDFTDMITGTTAPSSTVTAQNPALPVLTAK